MSIIAPSYYHAGAPILFAAATAAAAAAAAITHHLRLVRIVIIIDHALLYHAIAICLGLSQSIGGALGSQFRLSTETTSRVEISLHARFAHFPIVRIINILANCKALHAILDEVTTAVLFYNSGDS